MEEISIIERKNNNHIEQETCCICLENFDKEVLFNFLNFYDKKKIKAKYKRSDIKYQLECKCAGSVYHFDCLEHIIMQNYYDCKCSYCRMDITLIDKTRINDINFDKSEKSKEDDDIETQEIIAYHKRITLNIIYITLIHDIFWYFNRLFILNKYDSLIQILSIISFVLNFRLVLVIKHEYLHHDVQQINMFINALKILIVLGMNIDNSIKMGYLLLMFCYPLTFYYTK